MQIAEVQISEKKVSTLISGKPTKRPKTIIRRAVSKLIFQLARVLAPRSINHTTIFRIFQSIAVYSESKQALYLLSSQYLLKHDFENSLNCIVKCCQIGNSSFDQINLLVEAVEKGSKAKAWKRKKKWKEIERQFARKVKSRSCPSSTYYIYLTALSKQGKKKEIYQTIDKMESDQSSLGLLVTMVNKRNTEYERMIEQLGVQNYYNDYPELKESGEKDNLTIPRQINFVHAESSNYYGVQKQLVTLISNNLPKGTWGATKRLAVKGSLNISFFNRKRADILMSHGVADKNYFFREDEQGRRLLNNFTYAFVPGQFLRNKIINYPDINMRAENVHIVGWPRLDELYEHRKSYQRRIGAKLKVLWAPTHNFQNTVHKTLSSYPAFEPYLKELEKFCDVEVSLHPRNRVEKAPTGIKMAESDIVISDFGTMVYEALALGIPVIFPDWIVREDIIQTYSKHSPGELFIKKIGHHAANFDEMLSILKNDPVIDQQTKQFIDQRIAPETIGRSAEITAQTLIALSK